MNAFYYNAIDVNAIGEIRKLEYHVLVFVYRYFETREYFNDRFSANSVRTVEFSSAM